MPFPDVQLDRGATLEEAFSQSLAAFEAAGVYAHKHELAEPLPGVGMVFSCHEDGKNCMFIVRVDPWDDASAQEVLALATALAKAPPFMRTSSYHFISAFPVPEELTERLAEIASA
ncbi:hypothetical protein FYK55_17190 [Roseiconus nitratireducens]|uniref:Uncharacterized protein n=1 Tax=Roseiconus nitratireducens TaxID=2605748 RepID=A0A5M6D5S9_9BACT|nr:hypothetical protein [Roseiconus nitratireducens]KAA5541930.1 hypothetical protein FYK55_17190 [Roseiconus nitratireducens]